MFRFRRFELLFVAFAFGAYAGAEGIDDLLNEADQALQPGRSPAKEESVQPKARSAAKKPLQSQPESPEPSPQDRGKKNDSAMTPIDPASAQELMGVGLRRESQITDRDRKIELSGGFGVTRLRGDFPLTKDDDEFRSTSVNSLAGPSLAYQQDIQDSRWEGPLGVVVRPMLRARAGMMMGKVKVLRQGVQAGRFNVDYSLLTVSTAFGVRSMSFGRLQTSIQYGPAADFLIQKGVGQSDSTSGLFVNDVLEVCIGWSLFKEISVGLEFVSQGILRPVADRSGHDLIVASLRMPLPG